MFPGTLSGQALLHKCRDPGNLATKVASMTQECIALTLRLLTIATVFSCAREVQYSSCRCTVGL